LSNPALFSVGFGRGERQRLEMLLDYLLVVVEKGFGASMLSSLSKS
jgi:hypothetical protein